MATRKSRGSGSEKSLSSAEQQAKVNEIKKFVSPIANKFPVLCSEGKQETLKWRLEHEEGKQDAERNFEMEAGIQAR